MVTAVLLFVAIGQWPYSFYMFVYLVAFACGSYMAVLAFKAQKPWPGCVFILLAILFNPVARIYMTREAWECADLVMGLLLVAAAAAPLEVRRADL